MNDFDIVGWAGDGETLCADCVTHAWKKANDAAPIFAGTEAENGITCDECGEDIIEAVRYDFSVYMEGTSDWTFSIRATSVEEALRLARAGENEADGEEELYDYEDWEMHDGEPVAVYQSGVKGEVWKKPEPEPEPEMHQYRISSPELPMGSIRMSVDMLASSVPDDAEGLFPVFTAYVAAVCGIDLTSLDETLIDVYEWNGEEWERIT